MGEASLYGPGGERKYLNQDERRRVLAAMNKLDAERALFGLVLAWTGARVSEVLALTPHSFQVDSGIVSIVTLKRRKPVVREVPIPPSLMAALERFFSLRCVQREAKQCAVRLWKFSRTTAWRIVKRVMKVASVFGRQACPRGLRHAFGVGALRSGVPVTLLQRWMGHARLSTTSIYLAVCGPEEIAFARRFWRGEPVRQQYGRPRQFELAQCA